MSQITEQNIGGLKPSDLILCALDDLMRCEDDPRYRVDMDHWHFGTSDDGVCEVCLAGSVMAKSLGASPGGNYHPVDFNSSAERSLDALEYFREGNIKSGLQTLGYFWPPFQIENHWIAPYHQDKGRFFMDMSQLAHDLEDAGY